VSALFQHGPQLEQCAITSLPILITPSWRPVSHPHPGQNMEVACTQQELFSCLRWGWVKLSLAQFPVSRLLDAKPEPLKDLALTGFEPANDFHLTEHLALSAARLVHY